MKIYYFRTVAAYRLHIDIQLFGNEVHYLVGVAVVLVERVYIFFHHRPVGKSPVRRYVLLQIAEHVEARPVVYALQHVVFAFRNVLSLVHKNEGVLGGKVVAEFAQKKAQRVYVARVQLARLHAEFAARFFYRFAEEEARHVHPALALAYGDEVALAAEHVGKVVQYGKQVADFAHVACIRFNLALQRPALFYPFGIGQHFGAAHVHLVARKVGNFFVNRQIEGVQIFEGGKANLFGVAAYVMHSLIKR